MNFPCNDPMKALIAETVLKLVDDPEIGVNIVDLGLVYGIQFDEEEKKVTMRMTLTTEFCPMGDAIIANAKSALENAFPDYAIVIDLTFDPQWNYDRISAEGKEFLTM